MKKYLEFLLLLAPALLWWLSSQLLGDQFTLPNRLILAVLCTASGAAGLLMQRKAVGLLALVTGIGMLGSIPVEHDMPTAAFTLRMQDYVLPATLRADDPVTKAVQADQSADLVSFKGTAAQTAALGEGQAAYPYSYTSCTVGGRSFLSRHPLTRVVEEQRMGATQVRGELQAGDTALRFAVLDFSGLDSQAAARQLAHEYLTGDNAPRIALIDTGTSGNHIPLAWISYMTGFAKSERPWTAFTGTIDGGEDDSAQVFLHAPDVRCQAFEESALGMAGTYVVHAQ